MPIRIGLRVSEGVDPCQRRSLTFYSFAPRSLRLRGGRPHRRRPRPSSRSRFPHGRRRVAGFSPKCQCHFRGAVVASPDRPHYYNADWL